MPWMPRGAAMEAPAGASAAAAAASAAADREGEASLQYSPWFRLFQNAYAFSMAQQRVME